MTAQLTPKKPLSPIDVSSGSVSPHVIRPTPMSTLTNKQRSSSCNSAGSLSHQRSMSIFSLESPRNSIVSVDDIYVRPTRNDSYTSLASLNNSASPTDPVRARTKAKNTSVMISDEEVSESEYQQVSKRHTSDKSLKLDFVSDFKRNFKFKYDSWGKPKSVTSPSSRLADELAPSPLTLTASDPQHFSRVSTLSMSEPDSRSVAKKSRSSFATQSMLIKKKKFLSKDLQIELLSGHASSPQASPTSDTRYPFPVLPLLSPKCHMLPPLDLPLPHVPQHSSLSQLPVSSSSSPLSCGSPPLPPSGLNASPLYPSNHPMASPHLPSLRLQNKLIHELNRKWNRALSTSASEDLLLSDPALDLPNNRLYLLRKRGRSELTLSTDSLTTTHI